MRTLIQHVRYGLMLAKNLGFAAVAVLTLALLVGAGLLGRSVMRAPSIDTGLQTRHIMTKGVVLPGDERNSYTGKDSGQLRRVRFIHGALTEASDLPNVRAAGGTNGLPMTTGLADEIYNSMGSGDKVPNMNELTLLFHNRESMGDACNFAATPRHFRTLGIRLLRGRLFDERDTEDAQHVVLSVSIVSTRRAKKVVTTVAFSQE